MWIMCRPKFDAATQYSYSWGQQIVDWMKAKEIPFLDLTIEDAVREKVEETLKNHPDAGWLHYNHGSEDKVWGNDDRPVIDLDNYDLLKNRECYNLNCLSGKVLGKGAYLQYKATYWGYVESFTFTTDSLEEFKEAANHGFKLRIDGEGDWGVILEKTKLRINDIIDELIRSGRIFAASFLRGDRDALHCWSDNAEQPDDTPPPPTCPVSRFIQKYFGYNALKRLRLTRDWWNQQV